MEAHTMVATQTEVAIHQEATMQAETAMEDQAQEVSFFIN